MDLVVIGTGYVGLVAGTCLSEMGHHVVCIDKDQQKIDLLKGGGVPIYEPRLKELIQYNVEKKRLFFSTDLVSSVKKAEVVFIAVGTPQSEDGSADISMVLDVARQIGRAITGPVIVAIKSTVPVGTAAKVKAAIAEVSEIPVDVVSNPEFMKEGAAIDDFMKPDRIIIGAASERAKEVMTDIYAPFNRTSNRIVFMDSPSAEMTKYVSNAMLATRISFMNEMANLSEKLGADIAKVRAGVGSDPRIGASFLFPGVGYGGSCFPKDVSALIKMGLDAGQPLQILGAVDSVNERQKLVLVEKLKKTFPDLRGKKIGLWGLAFKPETDDMREAPSIKIIEALLAAGAEVRASDPEASETAKKIFGDRIKIETDPYEALRGADAMVVITEWNEFRRPDFKQIKELLAQPYVFDGRNIYNPETMRSMGFNYFCIGRP
ncbi:MAG: UDP-glucose/GDP-mannose dehydrogenase family protein [Deltaproteobacteria bacterium]|nr:UDP-glucose/GDP-mannose dehydrogenase family protein [Deltaproteobacteria bacterium]